jgi:hypothetical protein
MGENRVLPVTRPLLRRVLFVVVALVLLGLAWSGLNGGVDQWRESRTPGQVAQTLTQFAFALFAMLSLVTMIWGRRWNRVMGAALTVSLGLAGGLASVVWGGTSVLIGIVAALASAVVGLGITWLARVAAWRSEEGHVPCKPDRSENLPHHSS